MKSRGEVPADGVPRPRPHVLVIGGGIAGLSAAWSVLASGRSVEVTVLEAAPRTGGKLRTGEVAGHPVDLGAEAMLSRRPEAVRLARQVGLGEDVVHPVTTSAGVWTRGCVRPLPRTMMGIPADLDALRDGGIVGRRAVVRARLERALGRLDVTEDVAVGAVVARRLGREIRDRLVEPMLGGVYAGRADELSLHATVPQLVPAIAEHGGLLSAAAASGTAPSSGGSAPPVFAGIEGGVGRLATATDAAVRSAGGEVRCLVTVRELHRTATGFRVVAGPTIAPEVIAADAVILAVPAIPAARLLRDLVPAGSQELGRIEYASLAIVTLALRRDPARDLVGSGFLVPPVDLRTIKAATFSSRKWGWHGQDLELVRCSIGRSGDAQRLQRSDAELVTAARLDLQEATGLSGSLIDATVTRWGGALPQYTVGHLDRVRRVRESVATVPGLAVCGAAYDGLGLPACIATAEQAAAQVLAGLGAQGTMQG